MSTGSVRSLAFTRHRDLELKRHRARSWRFCSRARPNSSATGPQVLIAFLLDDGGFEQLDWPEGQTVVRDWPSTGAETGWRRSARMGVALSAGRWTERIDRLRR